MIFHRLAKAAFVQLDGEGARLYGGRWNSAGRPAVYAAASPSLAVLEVLVHLDLPAELLPDDYRLLSIEVPDDAPVEKIAPAPTSPEDCLAAGDDFLDRNAALVLLIPSVVVPQETNAILNVRHRDMARTRLVRNEPFTFPRLLDLGAR